MFESLEQSARRAKEANSFSDYKSGSATEEYMGYCKNADEIAQKAKARLEKCGAPADRIGKVDYLLNRYKAKKLEWLSEIYSVRGRVPSVFIAGPSNYPVRQKEKQLAREQTLQEQDPEYILDKIKGIGYNAKTIYSDDKNAVERIKAKIAALEVAPPDRWGYNKTEIRRLKGRLLSLAPEEFAEQQANITVNGVKTYKEIVALWDSGRQYQSQYDATNGRYYFDLPLIFTDGKRHYKGMVSIEIDESGKNSVSYNLKKQENELIPLTDAHKYRLIIGQISGSGNKAVIYQYLKGLQPQQAETPSTPQNEPAADTVTINGETAQVVRNKENMRLQLVFEGKPSAETRSTLKSNGFRWAPSSMAWQRLLNANSERTLKYLA